MVSRNTPRSRGGVGLRTALVALVLVVACAYLVLCGVFYGLQSRFVYHPSRTIDKTPSSVGLDYEDAFLETADGRSLFGWFVPADEDSPVVLFCHGNAGNIATRLKTLEVLHRLGLAVLIFDYRGYGRSDGQPSEKGTYLDAEAAWRYLVEDRGVPRDRIVVWGRSLGGSIAAWLAREQLAEALVIESTFTSFDAIASDFAPYLPVGILSRFEYDTKSYVEEVGCPILIVHSRQDESVPFRHGQALYEAAQEPKRFLEISGDHDTGFFSSGAFYEEGVESFLAEHVG